MLSKPIITNLLLGLCGLSLGIGTLALSINRLDTTSPWQLLPISENAMGKALPIHSLAITKKPGTIPIEQGQLVSFFTPTSASTPVIHRVERIINDNGERQIITKADKQSGVDTWLLTDKQITGVYVGHLPLLGLWFQYLQSQPGTVLLIIVPALIIVSVELGRIYKIVRTTSLAAASV